MSTCQSPDSEQSRCFELMQALSSITQVDSSEAMRQRFAEALAGIFPVSSIRYFTPASGGRLNLPLSCEIRHGTNSPEFFWSREPQRNIMPQGALARCLASQTPQHPAGNQHLDWFPICSKHKLLEIIEISQLPGSADQRKLLIQVLNIYANFLRILHDQEIDTLTGVYNRGAFDAELYLTAQSLRHTPKSRLRRGPQWWLLMIDVDHFKRVNDGFGHLIGDEVLLLVARLMRQNFRGVDRIYRYGGEEFAVMLSQCSQKNARLSAERLRKKIAGTDFPQVGQITISTGMAPIDRFDHVANIVGRADQALYQAKCTGRNRVCEYTSQPRAAQSMPLPAAGALELFSSR